MIRKKHLISFIQSMDGFIAPKIKREQYTTDAISTADFIYFVGLDNQDIIDKMIIDLGAGTGRLCLTALLFGAKAAVAIEVDDDAIEILKQNAKEFELTERLLIIKQDINEFSSHSENEENKKEISRKIEEIKKKISKFESEIHLEDKDDETYEQTPEYPEISKICIMNPPFGVHSRGADRPFLDLASKISDKIYSIHLSGEKNRSFITRFMKKRNWKVDSIHSQKLIVKGTYKFHKKPQKEIITDIFKIIPL